MDEWILDDLLECSVCLERLDTNSKVLPCQHTFCKKCLEEILRTHSELRCPECRIVVQTKIDELPPNVLLMRILEGLGTGNRRTISCNISQNNAELTQSSSSAYATNDQLSSDTQGQTLFPNHPCARASYDYISKEPGDLSFKKGDFILLRRKLDSHWYYGECNGNQGAFPIKFVQVVVPLPTYGQAKCKALYDFKMINDEEESCLSFHKGNIIIVLRRVDDNWIEGKLNEKIGIFPIAFVELNSAAKLLIRSHQIDNQASSSKVPSSSSAPSEDVIQHQVAPFGQLPGTSDSSSTSLTSPSSSCSSTTPTTSSSNHSSPTSPPPPPAPNKRYSFGTSTFHSASTLRLHRHSAEILNLPEGFVPTPSSINSESATIEQHSQLNRHGSQRFRKCDVTQGPGSQMNLSSPHLPAIYVALYPYKPQKTDELELKRGALYSVTEKCQDGWFKGLSVGGAKTGVFPGNYVEPAKYTAGLGRARLCRTNGAPNSARGIAPPIEPRSLVTYTRPLQSSANNPTQVRDCRNSTAAVDSQPSVASTSSSVSARSTMPNRDKKEKSSVSLLVKRLASMKKSKSPPPTQYSIDNPVFEDPSINQHVHIRSGSCPNQLLTSSSLDTSQRVYSPTSSHRSKERERPLVSRVTLRLAERSHHSGIEHRKSNSMDNPTALNIQDLSISSGNTSRVNEDISSISRNNDQVQPIPRIAQHDQQHTSEYLPPRQPHPENSVQTLRTNPELCENEAQQPVLRRPVEQTHDSSVPRPTTSSTPTNSQKTVQSPKIQQTSSGHHVRERFRCIVPYPPNSEYELELRLGDVIFVHKKRDDGWYKGIQQRTGRTGLFPASFVQSF